MSERPRGGSRAAELFDVDGDGVLVTGAASGLGFAIARVLAVNGARVTMVDVEAGRLEAAVAELAETGGTVRGRVADVRSREEVERVVAEAAAWGSGLDTVFANAGISSGLGHVFGEGELARVDDERWRRVLDTNLTGAFHTIRAAAASLNEGGRIVATTSVAGLRADPLVGYAYSSSKAALTHLVRVTAGELAKRRIRVNAIAPGSFLTEIGRSNPGSGRMLEELRRATLLGRLADPAEIEGIALLLASGASSHITGAVFTVDGGVMVQHDPGSDSDPGSGGS
jgi:NAD(P)-dependent dehydrogenase (short-subunit alcohol dehydrogenase family)